MRQHGVDKRALLSVTSMAKAHAEGGLTSIRGDHVRSRTLKMVHAALRIAFPLMGRQEMARLMRVDDVTPFVHKDHRLCGWWDEGLVVRMADMLNPDRIRRQATSRTPKPVPPEKLLEPGLPLCRSKREHRVEVTRKRVATKPRRPLSIAAPWDPEEARRPHQACAAHSVTAALCGDPPPHRSALAQRQAEVRA